MGKVPTSATDPAMAARPAGDAPLHHNWDIDAVVAGLRLSRDVQHNIRYRGRVRPLPSREAIVDSINGLAVALFPAHYGQQELSPEAIDGFVGQVLARALDGLCEQVRRSLPFSGEEATGDDELPGRAIAITRDFAGQLPSLRGLLVSARKPA